LSDMNSKFDSTRREKYLEHLREGMRRGAAAEAIGICRTAIYQYRKKNESFAEEETLAELDACEVVEDALFQAAQSGNVTACIFYLCNRGSSRWRNANAKGEKKQANITIEEWTRGL